MLAPCEKRPVRPKLEALCRSIFPKGNINTRRREARVVCFLAAHSEDAKRIWPRIAFEVVDVRNETIQYLGSARQRESPSLKT